MWLLKRQRYCMWMCCSIVFKKTFHRHNHLKEPRSILTVYLVFPQHHHIYLLVLAETAECFGSRLFFLPLALEHQQRHSALEIGKDLCFRSFFKDLLSGQGQLLRIRVDAATNKSLQTYFPFQETKKVFALRHSEKGKHLTLKHSKVLKYFRFKKIKISINILSCGSSDPNVLTRKHPKRLFMDADRSD